jgi:acyl carrier protein
MNTQDVITWVAEVFEEPTSRLKADTSRQDIAGWDSLGTLSLIAALDEKFDIHLDESEIDSLASVQDICELLRRHGAMAEA